jgi:hypothetical protein
LPLFRRERLHERLAREGGMAGDLETMVDGRPGWSETGVHGVHQPRQWDVVLTAPAPDLPGDETEFVALPDSTIVMDDDLEEPMLEPLVEAVDSVLDPPYRAEAIRRHHTVWAVAARRIETLELMDVPGEELTLTMQDSSRTLVVDGKSEFGSVPALERVAEARFGSYAASARRLDGDLWEVRISPL